MREHSFVSDEYSNRMIVKVRPTDLHVCSRRSCLLWWYLFLYISHFVTMAFALVYINASHHRALLVLPHFVMRWRFIWGVRRDARHQTMDGVECEQSWTTAVCSPDDGQASQPGRTCPSYRCCVISRSANDSRWSQTFLYDRACSPFPSPLLATQCTSLSTSAEDTRSESSQLLSSLSLLRDIFGARSSSPLKIKKCLELLPLSPQCVRLSGILW